MSGGIADESDGLRVLVCGGRDYRNQTAVRDTLDAIHAERPIGLVITGAAPGADTLAETWARAREVNYLGVPAKWTRYDRSAGPIRNRAMLKFRPQLVVAFPGHNGTADMKSVARAQHIELIEAP